MLAAVTMLNLLGVDVVADASTLFAGLVISPFAALVVCGLPDLNVTALTRPFSGKHIHWGTYLSVLLWNTSGYDSVGALAAEVANPGRDFPAAAQLVWRSQGKRTSSPPAGFWVANAGCRAACTAGCTAA